MIAGNRVDINGKNFQLSTLQTLKLLINGLLYTYRNERFHGDAFSPFKSSKTQIKTYAHSYFCLIATYFFISQLIFRHFESQFNLNTIANSLNENTIRFNLVFESHRRK